MRKNTLSAIQRGAARKTPVSSFSVIDAEGSAWPIVDMQGASLPCTNSFEPITADEADELLQGICSAYDRERMAAYMSHAQSKMLDPVINAFGLAKFVLSAKDGGNITTPHNAGGGVYAHADDKERYERPYNRAEYEPRRGFGPMRKEKFQNTDDLISAYTGQSLPKDGRTHVDHVVSAKKIYDNEWLRLSTDFEARREIAVSKENLVFAEGNLNKSKQAHTLPEWMKKSRPDGATNAERFGIDPERAINVEARARAAYEKEATKEVTRHFGTEIAKTGAREAALGGLKQAAGLLMLELSQALWDELRDTLRNGLRTGLTETTTQAIAVRLQCVGERVVTKWKDSVIAFCGGAASGFVSNLVTFVVNNFITTARNAVRMIREGIGSLLIALKMVFSPPENLTRAEAFHEAGKLMLAGVAVVLGIAIEEFVQKWLLSVPLLNVFAAEIATVLTGVTVGLGIATLCYMWDQLDLFGAERDRRHAFIMQAMNIRIEIAQAQSVLMDEKAKTQQKETAKLIAEDEKAMNEFCHLVSGAT